MLSNLKTFNLQDIGWGKNRLYFGTYPDCIKQFYLLECDFPLDFIEDITAGLERIEQLNIENEERLNKLIKIPVAERIRQRFQETNGEVVYGLNIWLHTSFHGSVNITLKVGHNSGTINIKPYFMWNLKMCEIANPLSKDEIDEFFELYNSFDYFSHQRAKNVEGLDGWDMSYTFHDGETARPYYCWCPEKEEKEFGLVEYAFRHLKANCSEDDYKGISGAIERYFRG